MHIFSYFIMVCCHTHEPIVTKLVLMLLRFQFRGPVQFSVLDKLIITAHLPNQMISRFYRFLYCVEIYSDNRKGYNRHNVVGVATGVGMATGVCVTSVVGVASVVGVTGMVGVANVVGVANIVGVANGHIRSVRDMKECLITKCVLTTK